MIGDAAHRRAEPQRRIDEEIRRERAAALGRAGERLDAALAETRALGRRLDAVTAARERADLLAAYARARAQALTARHALLIQREAIGLRTHRTVDQLFPEPPPRA